VTSADGVRLRPAADADAGELLTLQRAAYVSEAHLYDDPFLPPLVQTLDELRAELADGAGIVACDGGRLVAAVRFRLTDDTLHIGRLAVAPDRQGRGLGNLLLAAAEEAWPAHRAVLFTGHRSEGNLRLYERRGYREVRREPVRPGLSLVHLEKVLAPPAPTRPGRTAPAG
jgi:ribosomal protein S18 acetylase RimI-like enzyme